MTEDFTPDIVGKIRELYRSDEHARLLFDLMAQRERDASFTSIDRVCTLLNISRGDAVSLARALEEAECGEFIVGRKGSKSRFRWDYSCISLGQAAAGESTEIEETRNPAPDTEDETVKSETESDRAEAPRKLSIAEAKAGLAATFGVPPSSIEIIIRS